MSAGNSPAKKTAPISSEARLSEIAQRKPGRGIKPALIAGACLLTLLLVAGLVPRLRRQSELSAQVREQEQAMPSVTVITPRLSEATSELVLPATTQAIQETIIAARTSGYVRRWLAGMGQRVKQGQLLAELDVPETDQEVREARQQTSEAEQTVAQARAELAQVQAGLEQGEATLKQAQTNLALARVNLERSKTLVAQGVLSRQDLDDKQAVFDARQADVEAAQANVRVRQAAVKAQQSALEAKQSGHSARQANQQRLAERQSFERVTAPYDGIITARNIEVGTLINSSGGTATSNGLYRLARLDTIRVFINAPQTYLAVMRPGLDVEVEVKELPQQKFRGKVVGTSHSIDPTSRTLMVEVRVPNPGWQLLSGMYVNVKFALPLVQRALLIPVSALSANADGTQVLTVRQDQTVHAQKVVVGRDLGKEVEITAGLSETDAVITNPTAALHEGAHVQVARAQPQEH
jgi:RND family efflux transporter MFP subunit